MRNTEFSEIGWEVYVWTLMHFYAAYLILSESWKRIPMGTLTLREHYLIVECYFVKNNSWYGNFIRALQRTKFSGECMASYKNSELLVLKMKSESK
jgi:hypothetical protein